MFLPSVLTTISPSSTYRKRCVGAGPRLPPGSNSAVYCVKAAPSAGAAWTIAVAPTMPGSGARTKVSGVENGVIALRHAARLSEMFHESPVVCGRTNRPGCAGDDGAVAEDGLAAQQRAAHRAAERAADVGRLRVPLLQVLAREGRGRGEIHQREIGIVARGDVALAGGCGSGGPAFPRQAGRWPAARVPADGGRPRAARRGGTARPRCRPRRERNRRRSSGRANSANGRRRSCRFRHRARAATGRRVRAAGRKGGAHLATAPRRSMSSSVKKR